MSLDQYRRRVEKLAKDRDGEPIYNGSPDHASIIVEQMFKNACKQVSILTGRLNARVYGREEVVEEARLFLADKDRHLRIIMEEAEILDLAEHPLIEELKDHSNIEVRSLPSDYEEVNKYHFLIMDQDSFRFEPEKEKYAAVATFGESEGAQHLLSVFDAVWDCCDKVQLEEVVA